MMFVLFRVTAVFLQDIRSDKKKCMVIGLETRQHFISECSVFGIERQEFVNKLQNNRDLGCELDRYSRSPELFTQLVLDATAILKVEER